MNREELQKRAKDKFAKIKAGRKDRRFLNTMGKLGYHGILRYPKAPLNPEPIALEDALWAGQWEPRIYEVLPAVILKKPKIFYDMENIPVDLKDILINIRKGTPTNDFRGIPPEKYMQWVRVLGHKNKLPTRTKTFRFRPEDQQDLDRLKYKYGETSEIAVIRRALSEALAGLREIGPPHENR